MANFNEMMQSFRKKAELFGLKYYMGVYWFSYQNKRFGDSYWPAYKRDRNKKNTLKILKELFSILIYWRVLPYHYFRYGLYNKRFSYKKILNFVPETVFYYKILPKINSNYFLLDNKNIFEAVIKGTGLPQPRTILKIDRGVVFDSNNKIVSSKLDFKKIFNKRLPKILFLKPSDCGSGGKDITCYKRINNIYLSTSSESLNFENFFKKRAKDYILQEGLKNKGLLKKIHPESLNSFRIMTFFSPPRGAKAIYAILKAGNNHKNTDNAHTGGIYVGVNLIDGKLMKKGFDENLNEFSFHPITKFKFGNKKINGFNKVIKIAEKAANYFPSLSFIGWDIALTTKGPVILEGNSSPGLTIIQRTHDGLSKFYNLSNDFIKNKL